MVDLILLERVEKLGQMGQVVKVKPGYARNYLLPQKKAMRATKENLAYFETQRAQLEANNLQRKSDAKVIAEKMEGLTVVVIRQAGESGQLYGSVAVRDIAEAVTAAGYTVDKTQIVLDRPIKTHRPASGPRHAAPGGRRHRDGQCRAVRGRRAHAGRRHRPGAADRGGGRGRPRRGASRLGRGPGRERAASIVQPAWSSGRNDGERCGRSGAQRRVG